MPETDRSSAQPAARVPARSARAHPGSLFRSGLPVRLALAAGLAVPLWAAVLWAMAA